MDSTSPDPVPRPAAASATFAASSMSSGFLASIGSAVTSVPSSVSSAFSLPSEVSSVDLDSSGAVSSSGSVRSKYSCRALLVTPSISAIWSSVMLPSLILFRIYSKGRDLLANACATSSALSISGTEALLLSLFHT